MAFDKIDIKTDRIGVGAPVVPVSPVWQSLAPFDAVMSNLYWMGETVGGMPVNYRGDHLASLGLNQVDLPIVNPADAAIVEYSADGQGLLAPSIQFNNTVTGNTGRGVMRAPVQDWTASWSLLFVVYDPDGFSGEGLHACASPATQAFSAAVWGGSGFSLAPNGSTLRVGQSYLTALFQPAVTWRKGCNVILVCFDEATRQYSVNVNSVTPVVSGAGLGSSPAPQVPAPQGNGSPATAAPYWFFGNQPLGSGPPAKGRYPLFATFTKSLFHDPVLAASIPDLFRAAAVSYKIALA